MLGGLATSHKVGIAAVAAVFIAFALISSFLLPSWRPAFPGRRVGLFVWVTVFLTAGMLATVIALAAEPKEERATAGGEETTTAAHETTPATTTTAPTPSKTGNAASGKALFTAQGCNACHALKAAGSSAKVGPDLDNVAADAEKANHGPVADYISESVTDPNAYVAPGFPKGVMPAFQLSEQQIADLVAFITSK